MRNRHRSHRASRRSVPAKAATVAAMALAPALAALPLAGGTVAQPPDGASSQTAPTENETVSQEAAEPSPEPVTVTDITPRAVESDSTITVTGKVTNTGDTPLDGTTVRFRYSSTAFPNRSALEAYAEGEREVPGSVGPTTTIDGPIPPDESAEYELEIDAENLGWSGFGVYPIAVEAVSGDSATLGRQRTYAPYTPGSDITALKISWVWPLLDHPHRAGDDTFLSNELDERLASDGRLGRLLTIGAQGRDGASGDSAPGEDAEAENPDSDGDIPLAWAVDPALLDDAGRMAEAHYQALEDPTAVPAKAQPTPRPHESSENARQWLERARATLEDSDLITTPYADADIETLLRADLTRDATAAVTHGRETVERVLQRPAPEDTVWPSGGLIDAAARDFLAEHGAETFLLSDRSMPAQPWLSYTPTAVSELPTAQGTATALLADSRLRDVLGMDSRSAGDAALAQQRFAAETAMIAAERPGSTRTLVAVPPRTWDPSPEFASGLLEATETLPWLKPVAFPKAASTATAGPDRQGFDASRETGASHLTEPYLDQVTDVRRDARLLSSILATEGNPFRPAILRLEATAWRENEALAAQARESLADTLENKADKVRIIPGEPVTMASHTGQTPVLVANDLEDHAINVRLSVFSENAERLSIGEYSETMEIAPGGKTTVYVPLEASINGRTELRLSLHNKDGEPVGAGEVTVPVTVTGLSTSALWISGAAALVLVTLLAPRALRKWLQRRARSSATSGHPGANGSQADTASVDTTASGAGTVRVAMSEANRDMPHNGSTVASPRPSDGDHPPGAGTADGGGPSEDGEGAVRPGRATPDNGDSPRQGHG